MSVVYELHPRAAVRIVAGEAFLVTDDRSFHHASVPTAIDLLEALREGPRTAEELTALLVARYRIDQATAEADLERFMSLLVERLVAVRRGGDG